MFRFSRRIAVGLCLLLPSLAFAATHTVQVGQDSGGNPAFAFNPSSISIPSGDTITFVNNSGGFHNAVSADSGDTFNSGAASNGPWTYETPPLFGNVNYACTIHSGSGMTGSITVTPTPVSLQSFEVD